MKYDVHRFFFRTPRLGDAMSVEGLVAALQAHQDAERVRAGMVERGFSSVDAAKAAELTMQGVADALADQVAAAPTVGDELQPRGLC